MRLPWVSRTAYDLVVDERNRLRRQNDELMETQKRIRRVHSGLPETPRKRHKQEPIELPLSLEELIGGFASLAVRDDIRRQAREMHSNGTPFAEIERVLKVQLA